MASSLKSLIINVRFKSVLPTLLCSVLWGIAFQSLAQQSQVSAGAPNNKSLDCGELISGLEAKLFQSPNNPALVRAFEHAILLCQSIEKPIAQISPPQSLSQAALTFGVGYHSNPEFAADYDQIDLNFNGVSLRLTNPNKAKPSATQNLGLVLTHKRNMPHQKRQDEYQFNASFQRFDRTNAPNRLSTGLRYGVFFQQKAFSVSYQHTQEYLERQGSDRHNSNAYGFAQIDGLWAQDNGALNRLRLGRTFYANAPVLEGTLIEVQHFFSKIPLGEHTHVQPIIGLGGNIEVKERAGGNQWLWQAALGVTSTWATHELGYGMRLSLTQDVKKYSQLLERNAKRDLLNLNSYLKWRYLDLNALTPSLTLNYVKQESNIQLFNWDFWQIELSMQIKW
ncbi:MAG: hypothetical protein L3J01_00355 [Thiomicrorhabdus sp.]|nr:hypothetical protein [Thiomicrorhabdus sp.]